MNRTLIAATLAAGVAATTAQAQMANPLTIAQPEGGETFYAVIEIPAGGNTKYEINAETGLVFVDRYMQMPVVYPANYGSIPSSTGEDGDPLDALVLTREPVAPGAYIEARPIGVLKMVDDGEQDDKLVAVPASGVDATYDEIRTIEDLPALERQRIKAFFRVYKDLPEGGDVVEMGGFEGIEAAKRMLEPAMPDGSTAE